MILLKRYDPLRLPGGCRNATLSVSTYVTLWPPTLALCLIQQMKKVLQNLPICYTGNYAFNLGMHVLFSVVRLEPVAT